MCLRPLGHVEDSAAEYLAVIADNVNSAAAIGAVICNVVLAVSLLRWRPDLALLLSLTLADMLVGVAVAARFIARVFHAVDDSTAASTARYALLLGAATASLLSVAAIAATANCRSSTARRNHWLLVAGLWLVSAVVGLTLVLPGGLTSWTSSEECFSVSTQQPTQLVLWACIIHLFVVVVVAVSWSRRSCSRAVVGDFDREERDADEDVESGLAVVVACYGLCWLPFVVLALLRLSVLRGGGVLQYLFFGVGVANYAVKPILYAWRILGRSRPRRRVEEPMIT